MLIFMVNNIVVLLNKKEFVILEIHTDVLMEEII